MSRHKHTVLHVKETPNGEVFVDDAGRRIGMSTAGGGTGVPGPEGPQGPPGPPGEGATSLTPEIYVMGDDIAQPVNTTVDPTSLLRIMKYGRLALAQGTLIVTSELAVVEWDLPEALRPWDLPIRAPFAAASFTDGRVTMLSVRLYSSGPTSRARLELDDANPFLADTTISLSSTWLTAA